jgi:transcriptional regulator with XRE-family HTH domain
MSTLTKPNHIGRKISRIRELRDMKQEALAQALGTNQQAISAIENSETIDDEKLKAIAEALGVSVEGMILILAIAKELSVKIIIVHSIHLIRL